MRNIPDKSNDPESPENHLDALLEYNNHKNEFQGVTESTGQPFDEKSVDQASYAIADYAAASTYYSVTGTADALILTSIGQFKAPHAYLEGMLIAFVPVSPNTGSVTVNVTTLGNIPLLDHFGAALIPDALQVGKIHTARYVSGSFLLDDSKVFIPHFKQGLNLSVSSPVLLAAEIGSVSELNNNFVITNPNAGFTKDVTSTWAAGSGNGGLASALLPPLLINGNIDFFILSDLAGNIDFGWDSAGSNAINLLATPAVILAGFTHAGFINQWKTDASSNLMNLFNIGAFTLYLDPYPLRDFFGSGVAGSLQPITLFVATGRRVEAILSYGKIDSNIVGNDPYSVVPFDYTVIPQLGYDKIQAGLSSTSPGIITHSSSVVERVITDTTGRVKYHQQSNVYEVGGGFFINTFGWRELYWG